MVTDPRTFSKFPVLEHSRECSLSTYHQLIPHSAAVIQSSGMAELRKHPLSPGGPLLLVGCPHLPLASQNIHHGSTIFSCLLR